MEIIVEDFFYMQLAVCPPEFQNAFRKIYQQLKIVDNPLEVKSITKVSKNFYRITIHNSRISLKIAAGKATIGLFLYNEYYGEDEQFLF